MTDKRDPRVNPSDDVAVVQKLHDFLSGKRLPAGVSVSKRKRLTAKQAFEVIWFAREVLRLISDKFEMCSRCHCIYDSEREGHYEEKREKFYCENCAE